MIVCNINKHNISKYIVCLLIILISNKATSQVIDSAYLQCNYNYSWITDSTKPNERKCDAMILLVGKTVTEFYSYKTFQVDSLIDDDVKRGVPMETMALNFRKYGNKGILYNIFQNYPAGKITFVENFGRKNFRYQQSLNAQNWNILKDTSTILGYKVQKAISEYAGRKWIAWFAPDVPVNFGPWKLNGLPGLILAASDEKDYFRFTLTGLKNLSSKTPMNITRAGLTYTNVTRNELLKMAYKLHTNPTAFLTENMGMNIHSSNNSSIDPKPIKVYTPIELY